MKPVYLHRLNKGHGHNFLVITDQQNTTDEGQRIKWLKCEHNEDDDNNSMYVNKRTHWT